MASKPTEPTVDANQALADAITRGIVEATSQTGPIKQISRGAYKAITPWNPTGAKDRSRVKFARAYWQNGALIQRWQVTDEQVQQLNQLRPGRYLDRRVEVIERASDNNGDPAAVEIRYDNATAEQRFENKNVFLNFGDLLRKIVAEQGALVSA